MEVVSRDDSGTLAKTFPDDLTCRTCASTFSDHSGLIHVFSELGTSKGLPEKIARCLPVLISEKDELPTSLCLNCINKLEDVSSFFQSCFISNQTLILRIRGTQQDLDSHINRYLRHFSDPTSSSVKLEPDSCLDVDLSVVDSGSFVDNDESEEEEEEEDDESEEEFERNEREKDSENDGKKENGITPITSENFKVPHKKFKKSRSPNSFLLDYDPYFDDVDVDLTLNNPVHTGNSRNEEASGSLTKRGRKPLVPLSLKTCAECGEEFQDHASNLNHWKEKHPEKETYYKCTHKGCEFQSKQTDEVNKHRLQHKERDKVSARNLATCTVCGERYPPNFLLNRHMLVHQNSKSQNCPVCNKQFSNDSELSEHVRVHGPEDIKFSHCCHFCGKRFSQRANLDAHLRVHSGFKPFSCDFCGKTFGQKGNMEEHRRTHTGEKPYVCELCGFAFARRSELQLHNRCVHTGERPYQCAYCPKNFQRRDLLRKHERIHTDTRPYACEYCAKTFTQRDKMVVHTRLHTGERPYVCEVCGKGFCESGNLKKHLRVHGKEAPKIMHQNNKGKPPPAHPSTFIPTKSEHSFHRHQFPQVNSNLVQPPLSQSADAVERILPNDPTTPGVDSLVIDNRNIEVSTPLSIINSNVTGAEAVKSNGHQELVASTVSPGMRTPPASSSHNSVHASIAAAAAAMTQDVKPSAVEYTFPAVAAVMMQQQQQQHQVQHQIHHQVQQHAQQNIQQQQTISHQLHVGCRTPITHDDQSDTASERSITPGFLHHQQQSSQAPSGIPHYAMHGLIQHLSDWSAVYGTHHQLGHGSGGSGHHNSH